MKGASKTWFLEVAFLFGGISLEKNHNKGTFGKDIFANHCFNNSLHCIGVYLQDPPYTAI